MDYYKHEQALQEMANRLLHLFHHMPRPKVLINPRMETAAHAYGYERIEFQIGFVLKATFEEIEGVMKHELIHIWMHYRRMDAKDSRNHGPIFQKKAKEIGAVMSAKSYANFY